MLVSRWALVLGGLAVVLALAGATQLRSDASPDLLIDPAGPTARATDSLGRAFGGEPIAMVVTGDLQQTVAPRGMAALADLEDGARDVPGVQSVFGPSTLVDATVQQIGRVVREELGPLAGRADRNARRARELALRSHASRATAAAAAEEARLATLGPLRRQYRELFSQFSYLGVPSPTNQVFVQALTLGAGGEPKERLRWMFPDRQHAVVVVRLRDDLDDGKVRLAGRRLTRLAGLAQRSGLSVDVAGAPLVAAAMAGQLRDQLGLLLPLVAMVMILVLVLVQRAGVRRALLLMPALAGLALVAGLSLPLGLGLTPATLAGLPVALGLGVDFVVQLEARYRQLRGRHPPGAAARATVHELAPILARAGVGMAAGFAVLALSPVPLVQKLGMVLALGALSAMVAALVLTPALLVAIDRPALRPIELALPGAGRWSRRSGAALLALVSVATAAGMLAASSVQLSGDPNELASKGLPELTRARAAGRVFGSSGQIRIAVKSRDVTKPRVIRWMGRAQARIQELDGRLRPGPSLAELATAGGRLPDGARTSRLLRVAPPLVVRAILRPDHRLTEFSFGAPATDAAGLGRLQRGVDAILEGAPTGVSATAGGLAPAVTEGVDGIEAGRPWLLLAAIAAVAGVLMLSGYGLRRTLIVVIPAAAAAGISSLVLAATSISLSPLSATLEPLLVAITLEFSMLIEARQEAERRDGALLANASATAVRFVGAPVLTSAYTVALGFAVLLASPVPVLGQFGALAGIEVAFASLLALFLVPAVAAALRPRTGRRGQLAGDHRSACRKVNA